MHTLKHKQLFRIAPACCGRWPWQLLLVPCVFQLTSCGVSMFLVVCLVCCFCFSCGDQAPWLWNIYLHWDFHFFHLWWGLLGLVPDRNVFSRLLTLVLNFSAWHPILILFFRSFWEIPAFPPELRSLLSSLPFWSVFVINSGNLPVFMVKMDFRLNFASNFKCFKIYTKVVHIWNWRKGASWMFYNSLGLKDIYPNWWK